MIELEAIQTLHSNLETYRTIAFIMLFIGMACTFGLIAYFSTGKYRGIDHTSKHVACIFLPIVACVVLMIALIAISVDYRDQRDALFKEYFIQMDCEDLRKTNLELIKIKDEIGFNGAMKSQKEFTDKLYYYSCEVPLRDEVLKLQK